RHGNVYSLFLGGRLAVFLHGLQVIRQALVTQGADFAGRPQGLMINHVTENKGLIMANYGPVWKEHRRFVLASLKTFGLGEPVDPTSLIHSAASNVICSVLFGERFEYGDEIHTLIINSFKENAQVANGAWAAIYDGFPALRRLPLPFQKVFKNFDIIKKHIRGVVEQHKSSHVPGDPRDVIDCYLDEMEKRKQDGLLDEERLVMLLLDLHFAATDTTANTILSGILYLATHRDVQDRHQMPFVMATVHETVRLANIAPLGGTLVITNLNSVLSEGPHWERPCDFYPLHFLDDNGSFRKPEAFLPFSAEDGSGSRNPGNRIPREGGAGSCSLGYEEEEEEEDDDDDQVNMNTSAGAPGAELTDEEKEIINSVIARASMMESIEQQRI
ncbi:hypothetical protein CRUP_003754, partial [Coryphaenoides rupestris]